MFCKYCGEQIPPDSGYCSFCGRRQVEEERSDGSPISHQEGLAARKRNEIFSKFKNLFLHHKKWVIIISAALVLVAIVLAVGLPKILHKKPITVLETAGTPIETHFGLEYNIAHCGFQGKNLVIRMQITNNSSSPITLDSGTFDQYSELYDAKTKNEYSLDDQATSNYRSYSDSGSLFAISVVQTLQPGTSYPYDMVFTVSDQKAEVGDYLLSLYSFGSGENENHFSHFYTFRLQFMQ